MTTPVLHRTGCAGEQLVDVLSKAHWAERLQFQAVPIPKTLVFRPNARGIWALTVFFWTVHGPFSFSKENGGCMPCGHTANFLCIIKDK